ncbi:transposase [Streptomyces sp. NPDC051020]|uniref:IS110 family transposase n=1 Tax=Streptomyces sp. NPDC051020 TaxID=3155409 RepID=UPI003419BBC4
MLAGRHRHRPGDRGPAHARRTPLTVSPDAGCEVTCLPGLAMRPIADRRPGKAKSDATNAAVIRDAARTTPHTLRPLVLTDQIAAQ